MKIVNHILEEASFKPSPNFNDRPKQDAISLLVIHNISLPPNQFGTDHVEALFCNHLDCKEHPYFMQLEGLTVSAHSFIRRTGDVIQFVPFDKRAWHAGVSEYDGVENCNDYSIGIELEGVDDIPYTQAQYSSLATLTYDLLIAYPSISLDRIVGHSDVSPGRKSDPGPAFDWRHYRSLVEHLFEESKLGEDN